MTINTSVEGKADIFQGSEGEVRLWIEQGSSIQLKAITAHGDPVELSAEQTLELARLLQGFARRLES